MLLAPKPVESGAYQPTGTPEDGKPASGSSFGGQPHRRVAFGWWSTPHLGTSSLHTVFPERQTSVRITIPLPHA